MVVLSALPARDTDKQVPTNNTNRNTTKTAGRWSVRKNLGLLSLGGASSSNTSKDEPASASPSFSPPSSPPPAVVDHISEINPASSRKKKREPVSTSAAAAAVDKTSTESNRSWETTNTTATAWSSGTFEYEPSDASSSGASSASSSPNRPSTFLQTYETNHSNSGNMSTGSSRQSRRPSTSSSSSASGRRAVRPGTAGEVVRAIAQSASSVGIASSTTTSTAEAGTGVPGSRSRTNSPASSSSPNNMSSTLPRPPPSLDQRSAARSSSGGSGGVIHAQIRRRYSNPNLLVMAASVSAPQSSLANAGAPGVTTTSSEGGIAMGSATIRAMPRRSSLKKVSSYGPEAAQRRSSNNGERGSFRRMTAASSSVPGMSRRRHSMVDLTTAGANVDANNHDENNEDSLRNHRRARRSTSLPTIYKEVTFDSAVSYATISYVHDICPNAPERLFYADEDYHRMKGAIRADVKQIKSETKKRQEQQKMKETEKQRYYSDKHMDGTSRNVKTSSYLPSYNHDEYGEEEVESDSDLCNWGIEHHTCSKAERQERSERARSVINSVLWKQSIIRRSKSSSDLRNPDLVDTITSKLARTSIKASQVARIQAVERATKVEFHCSKIIDRRHSEGDAKYGARILDGLSDSEDEDIEAGKVKDASLDEVVGRRRPAYRRRASLA